MNALSVQTILLKNLDRVFDLANSCVKACTFFKTEGNAATGLLTLAAIYAPVNAIFVNYHSQDIDGSAVLVGDEKALVRASEIATITTPGPGDYLTESLSGLRRVVIAARLDYTGSFWTFQIRRCGNEDFGDLTLATADEDWGGFTATPLFDDLQN